MNTISRIPVKPVLAGLLSIFAVCQAIPSVAQMNGPKQGIASRTRPSAVNNQKAAVPAAVTAAAESSEEIYDAALANDWSRAQGQLSAFDSAVLEISKTASTDAAAKLKDAVSVLGAEVAGKQRQSVMRDANEATRLVARLTRSYRQAIPVDIVMLDYYGREMQLWAAAQDMPKLRTTQSAIRSTWDQVRPQVVARGRAGQAEARRFDGQIREVRSAKAPADYERIAPPFLEAVDSLENVF